MTLYKIRKQKDKDLALKLALNVIAGYDLHLSHIERVVLEARQQIEEQKNILKSYIGDKRTIIEEFYHDGSPILCRE